MNVFIIVELEQENGKDKTLADSWAFSSREKAEAFLRRRYDEVRSKAETGPGTLAIDFADGGWYSVLDMDNDLWEGFISEAIAVDGVTPACLRRAKNPFIEDKSHFGQITVRQLVEVVEDTGEFPKGLDTRVCIGDVEGNNGVNPNMLITAHKPGDIVLSIDPHEGDEYYNPEEV